MQIVTLQDHVESCKNATQIQNDTCFMIQRFIAPTVFTVVAMKRERQKESLMSIE